MIIFKMTIYGLRNLPVVMLFTSSCKRTTVKDENEIQIPHGLQMESSDPFLMHNLIQLHLQREATKSKLSNTAANVHRLTDSLEKRPYKVVDYKKQT